MRTIDLLLPAFLAFVFYCALPAASIAWIRVSWRRFREAFFRLQTMPELDYAAWRRAEGGIFQFQGFFDSFAGEQKVLIKNENLEINAYLENADIYLLLQNRAPEKLNIQKFPILTRGLRVFVGGALSLLDGERCLASTGAARLLLILYDGADKDAAGLVCNCGRHAAFYWNQMSTCSYTAGAIALVLNALRFVQRPAYQFVIIASVLFVFLPFLTLVPPGFFLTMLSRKLFSASADLRIKRDLSLLHQTGGQALTGNFLTAVPLEILSWLLLAAAAALNGIIILILFYTIFY